jgi:peptidoglycan/xylan/chitin deacetylase (PgdA/CDA1 family)
VIELAAAAGFIGAAAAAPMAARYVGEGRLARRCAKTRTLVLTYDDGPGGSLTPRVLDVLAAHDARATFFALGRQAGTQSALLDRLVREGHEVGCHTYGHVHAWKSAPWTSAKDVSDGFRALAPWVPRSGLFRPPYGKLTPFSWATARAGGARMAWWTHDSGDTWDDLPDAERIVDRVRRARGGVVLMHDFDREEERAAYVLALTERLLRLARDEGLLVVPLGGVLGPR